jgi:hypothetical protein
MTLSTREAAEAKARQRFFVLNAVRFGGLGMVMLGMAIAGGLLPLPWQAGAALAVVGLVDFFFVPLFLARSWKAGDDRQQ